MVEGLVDPAGVVHAREVREAAGRVDRDALPAVAHGIRDGGAELGAARGARERRVVLVEEHAHQRDLEGGIDLGDEVRHHVGDAAGRVAARIEMADVGDVEPALDQPAQEMPGQLAVLVEGELGAFLQRRAERVAGAQSPDGFVAGVDGEGRIVGVVEHVALVVADHDQGVGPVGPELSAQDRERRLDALNLLVDDGGGGDLFPRAARQLLARLALQALHHPRPVLRLLKHHRRVRRSHAQS